LPHDACWVGEVHHDGMVAIQCLASYNQNALGEPLWNGECQPVPKFKFTTNRKGVLTMAKFMSSHTLPAGTMKREQVDQLAQAAQNDPIVRPYRSFLNLAEGKVFCVMEAPNKEALASWFRKMDVPCDNITQVELEGERGTVQKA
jgi:uncharacterized protein DUF4242